MTSSGGTELPPLEEFIAFAEEHAEANPDFGPLFYRDVERVGRAYLELERRHTELLNLAERVSNSFIATQDRFGVERRRLLWALKDKVEAERGL